MGKTLIPFIRWYVQKVGKDHQNDLRDFKQKLKKSQNEVLLDIKKNLPKDISLAEKELKTRITCNPDVDSQRLLNAIKNEFKK